MKTAEIRFQLEKNGTKIGPYDLQLCGQALALDLTLVTHNTREFQRVTGLRLEDWEIEESPQQKRTRRSSRSPTSSRKPNCHDVRAKPIRGSTRKNR